MPTAKLRKPDWLKVRSGAGPAYVRIDRLHREQGLHSVCRSAACPNQGECWSRGIATFMILGDCCSRDCADLRSAGVDLLSLGQYLAPTRRHHPVQRFVPPEEFAALRRDALQLGFTHVQAGPLVRSSYHAEQAFEDASHAQG